MTSSASPSVNGTRTVSNNYQIDGADNNDAMFGGFPAQNQPGVAGIPGGLVPIDAIDQFSVQTNAGADMGRNSGSNVNMVIKSGTNQIHGTVYFFNRNEDLKALLRPRRSHPVAGRRRSATISRDSRSADRSSRTRPFSF